MSETKTDARGFSVYTELTDTYNALVVVKQSSSAMEDHVWIFVSGGSVTGNDGAAHLNREQAKAVRDALSEWLEEVEV